MSSLPIKLDRFRHKKTFYNLFHPPIKNRLKSNSEISESDQEKILQEGYLRLKEEKLEIEVHLETSKYQRYQYNKIKDNLSESEICMVLDWTLCETTVEKKVRILTFSVIRKRIIKYYDYFFQDNFEGKDPPKNKKRKPPKLKYLHTALKHLYQNYLKDEKITKIHFWSDRRSADFMNKKAIRYLLYQRKDGFLKNIEFIYHTFESRHGHNICDGHFGCGKV
jgi:hypothetical protein